MDHTEFRVGDQVVMLDTAPYAITTAGSIGVITAILGGDYVTVKYSKLTGAVALASQTEFDVMLKYCKKLQETYGPQLPPVFLKIREMYARQRLAVL